MAVLGGPVGDLGNLLRRTHLDKSADKKTSPPEAVESSAFKAHVCSARLVEGAVCCEYAQGTINIFGELAHLKFKTSKTPFEGMSTFLNSIKLPTVQELEKEAAVKHFENETLAIEHFNYPKSPDAQEVTTVIVNIDCSYPPHETSTIGSIGNLCKDTFKNMKPERSSANVHYGIRHWTVDSIFLPDNFIVLRQKWRT
jgi:hypothetical protein